MANDTAVLTTLRNYSTTGGTKAGRHGDRTKQRLGEGKAIHPKLVEWRDLARLQGLNID